MFEALTSKIKEKLPAFKNIIPPLLTRLVVLIAVVLAVTTVSGLQLRYSLPSTLEEAVIELTQESPSATPTEVVQKQVPIPNRVILETKENPEIKLGSEKLSSLCVGITESWKLVPNPEVEGQFIICNSENGQMATVSELNFAQNNYRTTNGLNALSISSDLCKIASERTVEIAKNFSHDGFEAAVDRSGIQKSAVGENIASGPLTAVQFVEWAWDRSSGHRANMLGDWTEGCAGVHDRFAVFIFAK